MAGGCTAATAHSIRAKGHCTEELKMKTHPYNPVASAFALALVCLMSLALPGAAQTSFPMLCAALPLGVERGKTTDITVFVGGGGGGNLYGAYKVLFSGEGVKAEVVPPEKGWPAKDPKKPWDLPGVDNVKVRVTVAADASLGPREFRLATPRHGISTVGQLVIDDGPQTLKKDDNTDLAHAQPVTIPCNIDGRFQNGEQTDHYKFK